MGRNNRFFHCKPGNHSSPRFRPASENDRPSSRRLYFLPSVFRQSHGSLLFSSMNPKAFSESHPTKPNGPGTPLGPAVRLTSDRISFFLVQHRRQIPGCIPVPPFNHDIFPAVIFSVIFHADVKFRCFPWRIVTS